MTKGVCCFYLKHQGRQVGSTVDALLRTVVLEPFELNFLNFAMVVNNSSFVQNLDLSKRKDLFVKLICFTAR